MTTNSSPPGPSGPDSPTKWAAALEAIMKSEGWNRIRLAEAMGREAAEITKYCDDGRIPFMSTVEEIAVRPAMRKHGDALKAAARDDWTRRIDEQPRKPLVPDLRVALKHPDLRSRPDRQQQLAELIRTMLEVDWDTTMAAATAQVQATLAIKRGIAPLPTPPPRAAPANAKEDRKPNDPSPGKGPRN
jgi:hypothetical protein